VAVVVGAAEAASALVEVEAAAGRWVAVAASAWLLPVAGVHKFTSPAPAAKSTFLAPELRLMCLQ
jgi:hypothetical protein